MEIAALAAECRRAIITTNQSLDQVKVKLQLITTAVMQLVQSLLPLAYSPTPFPEDPAQSLTRPSIAEAESTALSSAAWDSLVGPVEHFSVDLSFVDLFWSTARWFFYSNRIVFILKVLKCYFHEPFDGKSSLVGNS